MKRIAVLFLFLALPVFAIDTGPAFDDPELQARYETIIAEVRCLKCQNQSIKDSNAFLASDLRREIRRMLEEGKTDAEIYDFLVERYGDFALYRPRQAYLWLAPAVLILAGVLFLALVVRRRMTLPIDHDADEEDPA
ncbi:MAG: cytochrome c-type biogenesis protein CcmH [Woeseiaceae bacterium]